MNDRIKGKPYSIKGYYEEEIMSIHEEDDGTYYVEIQELDWNCGGLSDQYVAARYGLEQAVAAISAAEDCSKQELRERLEILYLEIKLQEDRLRTLGEERNKVVCMLREHQIPQEVSIGLKELPEDEPRIMYCMRFFAADSPVKSKTLAFRLVRDVDMDGDMDHGFVSYRNGRKHLVG